MTENLTTDFEAVVKIKKSDSDLVDQSFLLFKDMNGPILAAVISTGSDTEKLEEIFGMSVPKEIPDEVLQKASLKLREAGVQDDGRLAKTWSQMVLMHVAIAKNVIPKVQPRTNAPL